MLKAQEDIPAVTQQGRQTSQVIPRGSPLGSPWRAVLAWPTAACGGWRGGQGEIRGLFHCVLLDNCCDLGLERSLGATGVCFASPKLRERAAGCRGREGKRERGPSETPNLPNSAPLGLGNLFLSQAPQFPHLPGRSVQGRGANLPSPSGELRVGWESSNSLSVNAHSFTTIPAGNEAPLGVLARGNSSSEPL